MNRDIIYSLTPDELENSKLDGKSSSIVQMGILNIPPQYRKIYMGIYRGFSEAQDCIMLSRQSKTLERRLDELLPGYITPGEWEYGDEKFIYLPEQGSLRKKDLLRNPDAKAISSLANNLWSEFNFGPIEEKKLKVEYHKIPLDLIETSGLPKKLFIEVVSYKPSEEGSQEEVLRLISDLKQKGYEIVSNPWDL